MMLRWCPQPTTTTFSNVFPYLLFLIVCQVFIESGVVFSQTSNAPVIGVSPTSLSFTAVQGGANPATQYITVSNTGGGTLSWSSTDSSGWMTADASGTNTGTIPVAVFSNGAPAGTYSATVTISATGATTTTVPITVTITSSGSTTTSTTAPVIGVSPTSLSFTAVQGGANPATQYITVSNTGGGTLSWSSTDSSGWLTADASGTNTGTIPVAVFSNGAPAGTYSATVTISATGATTTTVPITVTITSSGSTTTSATTPVIGVNPTGLSFTAIQGGTNPATQYITVSNTGGGTVSWSSTDNSGWMSADASGTNSGTIPVNVYSNGNPAGSYSATVTIVAAGYPSQTKTVPITVTITPPGNTSSPTIGYSPTSLSFTGTVGGANPAGQAISISNSGGGTLSWTASDNTGWLSVGPTGGTNTGSATVSANLSGLAAGTYNGTITISASGATNNPQTVPVTFSVAASGTQSATLTWTANGETDLAGYKVYKATSSGAYGAPIATLGKTTSYSATGLQTGTTYFFVITAYDSSGNESSYSNEVSKSIF